MIAMKMRNPDVIQFVRVIIKMKETMGYGEPAVEKDLFCFCIAAGGHENRGVAVLAVTGFTHTDKKYNHGQVPVSEDRGQKTGKRSEAETPGKRSEAETPEDI